MTVPSTPRIAGPFLGTGGGTTGPFPFTYPIFATTDVLVVNNVGGVQTTLTIASDYTVSMNADQTNNPGGTVTLTAAIFTGSSSTLGSQVPQTQATVITNLGGFLPTVLNNALDKLTILIQQLTTTVSAALSFPISDGNAVNGTLPTQTQRANGGAGSFLFFSGATGAPGVASGISSTAVSVPMVPVVQAGSLASALSTLGGVALTVYNAFVTATNTALALLAPLASPTFTGTVTAPAVVTSSLNGGQFAGLRNRLINGDMRIDQRNGGASQSITTGAYTVDRWQALATGAAVTGQQIAGSGADQYLYQITGAASVTGAVLLQKIEATNIWDLASTTVTLSAELSNSLLTTVTWTAFYANSADNFSSTTQIATGTFTVNSTLSKYSAQIALPANAKNGVQIQLSVGAQTSGTWKIGQVQLENGSAATPFERRPLGLDFGLCQRYYEMGFSSHVLSNSPGTAIQQTSVPFKQPKRATPTATVTYVSGSALSPSVSQADGYQMTVGFGAGSEGLTIYYSYTASAEL